MGDLWNFVNSKASKSLLLFWALWGWPIVSAPGGSESAAGQMCLEVKAPGKEEHCPNASPKNLGCRAFLAFEAQAVGRLPTTLWTSRPDRMV